MRCGGWGWGGRRGGVGLAGDDGDGAVCGCGEATKVVGIAGEDLIAVVGERRDGRIDGIAEAGSFEEDASVAGECEINGDDFYRSKEPRELGLRPGGVSPDQRDHDRRGANRRSVLLGRAKADRDLSVVAIDGDQRSGVENEAAQPASLSAR